MYMNTPASAERTIRDVSWSFTPALRRTEKAGADARSKKRMALIKALTILRSIR